MCHSYKLFHFFIIKLGKNFLNGFNKFGLLPDSTQESYNITYALRCSEKAISMWTALNKKTQKEKKKTLCNLPSHLER